MTESPTERFARILAEHGPGLARVANGYAATDAEREDLRQEIALAVLRALPSFRGEASERTFVFRIAHNRCMTHLCRRRVRGAEVDVPDPRDGPVEHVIRAEQRTRLLEAVRALPITFRQVVMLALEGLSHREIGEVVGITDNNVAVRLTRARQQLKDVLEATP